MKIYRDVISGDELLSDTFKIELVNEVVYKVKGKLKTETIDVDERMYGGNASQEGGGDEGADASSVSGVDVVLNHKLQPSPMKKSAYMTYIKAYMKAIKDRLAKDEPDEVDKFQKNIQPFVKDVLGNFKEYDLYIGESFNPDAMVVLLTWEEETPYVYFFKHGLLEEKV